MAVYTHVSAETLSALLEHYDAGTLTSVKGIAEGVENSNYLVDTTAGRFILTLYEKRVDSADLPFFMALLDHLADKGLPVPRAIRDNQGRQIQQVAGRPACLIEFLQGVSVSHPNPAQARATGAALGQMHAALADFTGERPNSLGTAGWHALASRCSAALDAISPGLGARVAEELAWLDTAWPTGLPQSVIHADLFPDNVLMRGDAVTGVIDFYFACSDVRAWDLAVTHASWCFENDGTGFHADLGAALIAGYRETFGLSAEERAAFPALARGACLRFLLTRAWDWLNTPADALVTRKDPLAFLRRLDFYRDADLESLGLLSELPAVQMATDGACKGNPGPGGWGVVIRSGDKEKELSGGEKLTTNNRMEMTAAIRGLTALTRPCRVTLSTDSRYVMDGLTKWLAGWQRNGWRTASKQPVKNADLWQELIAAAAPHRIRWEWVKGHAGHPENERADKLASDAAIMAGRG